MPQWSHADAIDATIGSLRLGFQYYRRLAEALKGREELQALFTEMAERSLQQEKSCAAMREQAPAPDPEAWSADLAPFFEALAGGELFLGRQRALPPLGNIRTPADAVRFAVGFEKETLLALATLREVLLDKKSVDRVLREKRHQVARLGQVLLRLAPPPAPPAAQPEPPPPPPAAPAAAQG